MTDDEQQPGEEPRRRYSRTQVTEYLERRAKEDPEWARKVGESARKIMSGYEPPVVRSPLVDQLATTPPPTKFEVPALEWDEGKSPYELSRTGAEASLATAELLDRLLQSNAESERHSRRVNAAVIALSAVSAAAAIAAAVAGFIAIA